MGKIKDGRNLNKNGNSISKFKLYNKQIFDIQINYLYFDDKHLYENLHRSSEEKDSMKYGIWHFSIASRTAISPENHWTW